MLWTRVSDASVGRYSSCSACFQSTAICAGDLPVARSKARSTPRFGVSIINLADHLIAPAPADEREERLAEAVREERVRIVRHLRDRRNVVLRHGVAHDDVGMRVARPLRHVLGHALHEPERRIHRLERAQAAARLAVPEDIELELVHHFVREHVLGGAVVAGEEEEHPVAERLGDATHALAQVAGHEVLAEIRARGEEHDRLLVAELPLERAREALVRAFGHARDVHRDRRFGGIVVNREVLRLDDVPLEMRVLHLVLAELRREPRRGRAQQRGTGRETKEPPVHCAAPCASRATPCASPQSRSSW